MRYEYFAYYINSFKSTISLISRVIHRLPCESKRHRPQDNVALLLSYIGKTAVFLRQIKLALFAAVTEMRGWRGACVTGHSNALWPSISAGETSYPLFSPWISSEFFDEIFPIWTKIRDIWKPPTGMI